MIYERRVYTATPGKLPALIDRFENATLPIFDRLGIKTFGFFTTAIGGASNELSYYIIWENLAEREAKMAAFGADEEWIAARIASEANGPLTTNIATSLLAPARIARL